jgi:hypothetical protein
MPRRARAAALAEYDIERYLARLEAIYLDMFATAAPPPAASAAIR